METELEVADVDIKGMKYNIQEDEDRKQSNAHHKPKNGAAQEQNGNIYLLLRTYCR